MEDICCLDEYDIKTIHHEKRIDRLLTALIIICSLICIYVFGGLSIVFLNHKDYTLKEYNKNDYNAVFQNLKYEYLSFDTSQVLELDEAKQIIINIVNPKLYIMVDSKEPMKYCLGCTYILLRYIVVDSTQPAHIYLPTVLHELIHLTYFTANETYTHFMTFKLLWEHENAYIHYLGCRLALDIFNHQYDAPYTCIGNIIEYFKIKEDI